MAYQPKSYRKFAATTATAAMVASAVAPVASLAAGFTDVAPQYKEAVDFLVSTGATNGKTETQFGVYEEITRLDAAVILAKLLKLDVDKAKDAGFTDVPKDRAKYVNALVEAGVLSGKGDGKFGAYDKLTRVEMAKIVANAYKLEKQNDSALPFTDVNATWAPFVKALYDNGVTSGKTPTSFGAYENITRGDFAQFVYRAAQLQPGDVLPEIASVKATGLTTVEVTFTAPVDEVSAENFTIEGGSVISATLSADKKTATLKVSGLDYDKTYTLAAKNILVNGKTVDLGTKTFKTPAVSELWELRVTPKESTIVANGADNTEVTFELISKETGKVDENADDIVLDLNTTYGTLAQKRVTIQDGKATVLLTSEFSNKEVTAKIDAQIIEASEDYKDLIGKVAGNATVTFKPAASDVVQTITLVGGESNQADRVTVFFDKEPTLEQLNKSVFVVKQGNEEKQVRGFKLVKDNPKAVEVILEKDAYLTDNKEVTVVAKVPNSTGQLSESSKTFKLTDARVPEVTSVQAEGLNKVKVVFSEAIRSVNFIIDGQYLEGKDFTVEYGDFNPQTHVDQRNVVTIKLNDSFQENAKAKKGYFTPGQHSLQVSSVKDFAALTDANNIGTTQNLTFNVIDDTTKPEVSEVKVESPEQFRIKFNKVLKEADLLNAAGDKFELQVYNEDTGKYENIFKASDKEKRFPGLPANIEDLLLVKPVLGTSEYIVELKKDWTQIYNTQDTQRNYYNDKFRIVIGEGSVTNEANGEKNAEITLDLNYKDSPLNGPDVTSPEINDIVQKDNVNFVVQLSEPVKLKVDGVSDDAGDTLAQKQAELPTTLVDFIGKDEKGKTVTVPGKVVGYADASEKSFIVTAPLQELVNKGYDENWTVVVKSISDDVGNTAPSLSKGFKVSKALGATPFAIDKVEGYFNGDNADKVRITFTEGVQYRGGVYDATNPAQYTLNGKTLPVGTSITVEDGDGNVENGYEVVVITLPDKTLLAKSNVVTVNKNLQSADGSVLEGEYEKVFNIRRVDY
ncbi:S-layer homology domain-containing protein, partial [Geobacillus stearothermophilus]|uniref:S-layer homology domain-containing protein n=1 Tax=Geobacillus stearothermophilus TaxID=1422 RepID=UPI003D1BF32E